MIITERYWIVCIAVHRKFILTPLFSRKQHNVESSLLIKTHPVIIQIYIITDGFISLALQLMLVAYNIAIGQCQKSYYCSPLANTSTCANTSSYVERACLGQNTACMAYSCNSKSSGCSCKLGSYNCSINCNYDIYSDLCDCRAETHSCTCLGGVYNTPSSWASSCQMFEFNCLHISLILSL